MRTTTQTAGSCSSLSSAGRSTYHWPFLAMTSRPRSSSAFASVATGASTFTQTSGTRVSSDYAARDASSTSKGQCTRACRWISLASLDASSRHQSPMTADPDVATRLTESADAFWQGYVATLPADHPHRHAQPDAFAFGDSPALADALAALVQIGRKRATTSLPVEFTSLGQPLPAAGDVSIITRADGVPVAIIELTEVKHVAFQSVDAAFAADEGEGDATLAWWQAAHRRYFNRVCARLRSEERRVGKGGR